jgi:CRP/FNR family cyclic AMP-dependent transcriptional regulator
MSWRSLETCHPLTRARLERAALPLCLAAGEALFTAGGAGEHVVFVSHGVVRVFHALSEGSQFTVQLLRAPSAFGVLEVLHGLPWAVSVEALTPLKGIRVPADTFRAELSRDHGLTRGVLEEVASQLDGTLRASRALGFEDCEHRLFRVLLEYAEHFGRPCPEGLVIRYPLSRHRLALEIGAARRSVDRALAGLAADKLLSLSPKGWQVLHDPERLRDRLRSEPAGRATGRRRTGDCPTAAASPPAP